MCYWILPESGIAIARSTVVPVSTDDKMTDEFKEAARILDDSVQDAAAHEDRVPAWLTDISDRYF